MIEGHDHPPVGGGERAVVHAFGPEDAEEATALDGGVQPRGQSGGPWVITENKSAVAS